MHWKGLSTVAPVSEQEANALLNSSAAVISAEQAQSANWASLELTETSLANVLGAVKGTVPPVIEGTIALLETARALIETVSTFVLGIADVETEVLRALIDTARGVLEDLTATAGLYALPIPLVPVDRLVNEGIIFENLPGDSGTLEEYATNLALAGSGGNKGFLRAVSESLSDVNDTMRPRFNQDAYVAGAAVIYGSDNYAEIALLLEKLKLLFSNEDEETGMSEGLDDNWLPRPQGLEAEVVPTDKTSSFELQVENRVESEDKTNSFSIRISWDLPEEDVVVAALGGRAFELQEVVVYRSTENPIPIRATQEERSSFEYKRFNHETYIREFYDDAVEPGSRYFYAVGFVYYSVETEAQLFGGEPKDIVGIQVAIPKEVKLFPRTGVAPDWFAVKSPLALVPGVDRIVRQVNNVLDALEKRLDDKTDQLEEFIEGFQAQIDSYKAFLEELLRTIDRLVEALSLPTLYIGMHTFSGQGGNDLMLSSLGKALTNIDDDPAAPPFTKGNELVGGFVLMAGANTPGVLEKFKTTLEFLTGVAFESGKNLSESVENAYAEALDVINKTAGEVERNLRIEDDFSVTLLEEEQVQEQTGSAVGADLQPADERAGCEG